MEGNKLMVGGRDFKWSRPQAARAGVGGPEEGGAVLQQEAGEGTKAAARSQHSSGRRCRQLLM